MDEISIKVEPAVLKNISDEVLRNTDKVDRALSEMERIVNSSGRYWDGEGHNSMKNAYDIRKDDYARIIIGIKDHVKNLQTIAGVYESAEKEIESLANELPGDVIF